MQQQKKKEASPPPLVSEPSASESEEKYEEEEEKPKETTPDSDPDFLDQVEMIVDEFMDILVGDAENDPDLIFDKPIDEDQFKDKFPFNIKKEEPEPVVTRSPSTIPSARSTEPPAKT